ncbi:MAG: hypothetical protein CL600_15035, partial [Alteromonas sp.]|nr:hypothetical protein [Alteromonas sp.]
NITVNYFWRNNYTSLLCRLLFIQRSTTSSLMHVKDSLLPKLISGEIRLNPTGKSGINEEGELQGV